MHHDEMNGSFSRRLLEVLGSAARVRGDNEDGAAVRLAASLGVGSFTRSRSSERPHEETPDGERVLLGLAQGLMSEAAEELSAALTGRGIQHFFVKGMALAERIYQPGEREMVDIDVHVVPSAREAVKGALEELGYFILPDEEQAGPAALRSGIFAGRYAGSSQLEHIGLDLAWGLDPVDRLLPRPDRPVPREVWDCLDLTGSIPVPKNAHHVALLVHHLVHHDMLHFRGLVDLALLWPKVAEESSREVEILAKQLGVLRATRLLAAVLQSDFGVQLVSPGPAPADRRGKRARRMLDPVCWCTWVSNATAAEFVEINLRRIRRRLLLLDDVRATPGLLADAVIPPREYLRWRWPEARSTAQALLYHLVRVAGKVA
jgi:hypothetical protein